MRGRNQRQEEVKLDYAMPGVERDPRLPMGFWLANGSIVGFFVTPVALVLALASGMAGHGDYILARLLFPLEMLATAYTMSITKWQVLAAVVQFPIYGLIFGFCLSIRGSFGYSVMAAVIIIHVAAAVACFSGMLHGFI